MRVLVTGGGGFVGQAVVRELLARGHDVDSASRGAHPELDELGVTSFPVDLADETAAAEAVAGHEAVVHAAAKTGVWGRRADFFRNNVDGTRNVLAACLQHGVERFVYTTEDGRRFHRSEGEERDAGQRLKRGPSCPGCKPAGLSLEPGPIRTRRFGFIGLGARTAGVQDGCEDKQQGGG